MKVICYLVPMMIRAKKPNDMHLWQVLRTLRTRHKTLTAGSHTRSHVEGGIEALEYALGLSTELPLGARTTDKFHVSGDKL